MAGEISMNKTDRLVVEELTEKWSSPDHDCPFAKVTREKLCDNYNDCKICIRRNAFTGLEKRCK